MRMLAGRCKLLRNSNKQNNRKSPALVGAKNKPNGAPPSLSEIPPHPSVFMAFCREPTRRFWPILHHIERLKYTKGCRGTKFTCLASKRPFSR